MKRSTTFTSIPVIDSTIVSRLSQFWTQLQHTLFPFLLEVEHLDLTPKLEQVIRVLEFVQIDRFIPSSQGLVGRPPKDRIALARAFVAKAILNLGTTEMLIDRLRVDQALRRICGFEQVRQIPDASRFSRAFAEFTESQLPALVHAALIRSQLEGHIMGHAALDSTAIEANEKPLSQSKAPAQAVAPATVIVAATDSSLGIDSTAINLTNSVIESTVATNHAVTEPVAATDPVMTESAVVIKPVATTDPAAKPIKRKRGRPSKNAPKVAAKPKRKKRGRPSKQEEQPIDLTRIESQISQSIDQALAELPTACDVGSKRNSKGHTESWVGYKLHIETVDGDIPVAAVLTSASVHDSQVAIPLIRIASERVTYLYDLADAAYCSGIIREESQSQGHVPLIDHNPRRGEKKEFAPHEAERYKTRSQAERVNSSLKDNHGGRNVRVKGAPKVYAHLMFGILVIAAEQILRLIH